MAGTGKSATPRAKRARRPRARHDQAYKAFFGFIRTLQDLLCGFVPEHLDGADEWFERLDFTRAEPLPTEIITSDLSSRYIDMLWRVPIVKGVGAGSHVYVVVMLEFQSRVDRLMALRVQCAAARIYEYLHRNPETRRLRYVVPILPIVVYNGPKRWNAPTRIRDLVRPRTRPAAKKWPWEPGYTGDSYVVIDVGAFLGRELPADNVMSLMIRTETMDALTEAGTVLEGALRLLDTPELKELRQQFRAWFRLTLQRQGLDCEELEDEEEMQRQAKAGKIRTFLDARIHEVHSKMKAESREEGREEALAEALERDRALLQGQAKLRFGAETADRLAGYLAKIREHDRLIAVSKWILDCASGTELLERVEGHS